MPEAIEVQNEDGVKIAHAVGNNQRNENEATEHTNGAATEDDAAKAQPQPKSQPRKRRAPNSNIAASLKDCSYSSLFDELKSRLSAMSSDECFLKCVEINMATRKELGNRNEHLVSGFDLMMRGLGPTGGSAPAAASVSASQGATRLNRQYQHPDGKMRRVPPTWSFPKLTLQPMYLYWHCGDESKQIPPAKHLLNSDVDFLGVGSRGRINELRRLMELIDAEAKSKGYPPHDCMDETMANTCYLHGKSAIAKVVPDKTPSGKVRSLDRRKWRTIAKLYSRTRGYEKLLKSGVDLSAPQPSK